MKNILFAILFFSVSCQAASWECIVDSMICNTWRMQVPHGWLVRTSHQTYAIIYVPDEEHEWKI